MKRARDPQLLRRFGAVLRQARIDAGLTQEELAGRSGLDVSFVSRIERGVQGPSLEAIVAIGKGLNVSAHRLVQLSETQDD